MEKLELCYEVFTRIDNTMGILLTAYCLVIWIRPFMADTGKIWRVGAVYAVSMIFFDVVPFYIGGMLVYVLVMFEVFLVMRRLDREYTAQKLFLAVAFFCVRWQAWRVILCISNEVLLLTGYLFRSDSGMFWFWIYAVRTTGDTLLAGLLMYGAVRCLQWAYGCRREHMNIREFVLLVMPSVSGALAYGVFRYYNYVYQRDTGCSPFDLYGSFDFIILFYSAACFVTIFVMTYVFRQWKNEQEEDRREKVFSRQMQDLESHIAEVERLYRDMRRLRHDMGNHLMTLEQLYGRGAYEDAGKYAEALKVEVQGVSSDVASGNPVTDVILSGRKKEMEEKGIGFDCDFHYPRSETVNAVDISIILNNALTNAIEAVERERMARIDNDIVQRNGIYNKKEKNDINVIKVGEMNPINEIIGNVPHISLTYHCIKNMYIIEVVNSYTGELIIDSSSGLPRTSKSGDGHGFGLANIRHVAQKYYGDIEIGKELCGEEECCVLRVMLQLFED